MIPLFMKQIKRREPLTVTAPQMTRFILTLDDSVDLVVRAMQSAQGGEIFVRRAPASTVQDLANAMRLRYSELGGQHPITTTGIRPGEKIHEVLVNEYEIQRAVSDGHIFVIHPEYRPVTPDTPVPLGEEYTSENTTRLSDPDAIGALLDRIGTIEEYA